MKLFYFAWVREQVGVGEETVDVPGDVATVSDLMTWLGKRDDGYAAAFAKADVIRAAIDQEHAGHETMIAGAQEIAFFPPVTGG
ncbi:MAG: molybdopterin converting factor subunit 1 [Hyphomicrobiaceae bacterium]